MNHDKPAFHTSEKEYPQTHRDVYHNQPTCPHGKAIKSNHRVEGTGDKQLCSECKRLSQSASDHQHDHGDHKVQHHDEKKQQPTAAGQNQPRQEQKGSHDERHKS